MSEHMPTVTECEQQLEAEERYMDHAILAKHDIAIALAQGNINHWTRLLVEARVRERDGWRP